MIIECYLIRYFYSVQSKTDLFRFVFNDQSLHSWTNKYSCISLPGFGIGGWWHRLEQRPMNQWIDEENEDDVNEEEEEDLVIDAEEQERIAREQQRA